MKCCFSFFFLHCKTYMSRSSHSVSCTITTIILRSTKSRSQEKDNNNSIIIRSYARKKVVSVQYITGTLAKGMKYMYSLQIWRNVRRGRTPTCRLDWMRLAFWFANLLIIRHAIRITITFRTSERKERTREGREKRAAPDKPYPRAAIPGKIRLVSEWLIRQRMQISARSYGNSFTHRSGTMFFFFSSIDFSRSACTCTKRKVRLKPPFHQELVRHFDILYTMNSIWIN